MKIVNKILCFFGLHDWEIAKEDGSIRKVSYLLDRSEPYVKEEDLTEQEVKFEKIFKPAKVYVCLDCGKIKDERLIFAKKIRKQKNELKFLDKVKNKRKEKALKIYNNREN